MGLGKKLLEAARQGQDDETRLLMANGAPFITVWVSPGWKSWGSGEEGKAGAAELCILGDKMERGSLKRNAPSMEEGNEEEEALNKQALE